MSEEQRIKTPSIQPVTESPLARGSDSLQGGIKKGKICKTWDWPVVFFLGGNSVLSLLLSGVYFYYFGVNGALLGLLVLYCFVTNLSITAGYHRYFSHRSYEAHPWIAKFFLAVGAGAWQGSVLQWAVGHRQHHREVDTEKDPYSIKRGFWSAHMEWMLRGDQPEIKAPRVDLDREPGVVFQHKYYITCAIVMGYFVPTLLGAVLLGDALGGLIVLGALRIFLTQQSTYFVNSLAHILGSRPYSQESSARDNLLVAFLTNGEGYHNFHHTFQADYRNGIKWYHWDPTKWFIQFLAGVGLAFKLKRVSASEILKARLHVESLSLQSKGFSQETLDRVKERILGAQEQIRKLKKEYDLVLQQQKDSFSDLKVRLEGRKIELQLRMDAKKLELTHSIKQWRLFLKSPIGLNFEQ